MAIPFHAFLRHALESIRVRRRSLRMRLPLFMIAVFAGRLVRWLVLSLLV